MRRLQAQHGWDLKPAEIVSAILACSRSLISFSIVLTKDCGFASCPTLPKAEMHVVHVKGFLHVDPRVSDVHAQRDCGRVTSLSGWHKRIRSILR